MRPSMISAPGEAASTSAMMSRTVAITNSPASKSPGRAMTNSGSVRNSGTARNSDNSRKPQTSRVS